MAARRRTPRRRIGAFFDMDKTLIAENSGALFMRYRYEQGQLSGWELASGLAAYLRYKVGMLDIRAWTADAMKQFAGESERALTCECLEEVALIEAEALLRARLEGERTTHVGACMEGHATRSGAR